MPDEENENLVARPPVVAVLGHVDHGKSSLLEAIKEDFVITSKESGGITQHIGAYEVIVPSEKALSSRASQGAGEGSRVDEKGILHLAQDDFMTRGHKITFIDTPGHEAFSAMRQRGANLADIALLVIDAAEGVKDQTKEAIKFIKMAGIPLIVVFNKMDKPGALPDKVKPQLAELDVLVESYGGKVPSCNVSARTKQGIDELLETILLVAEMEELKANIALPGRGTVIESSLNAKKGPVATLILREGILKEGDILATSYALGKAKGLADFQGKPLKQALPSQPVRVLGFEEPPGVGQDFKVCFTREEAEQKLKKDSRRGPQVIAVGEGMKILNIILKTDVLGSCEAIEGILKNLPQEKVVLRLLKSGVGDIIATDVDLAESGRAKIFGFRVKLDEKIKLFAQQKKVKIKLFEVIYELVQEVRRGMLDVLEPEIKRVNMGKFKVTHLFKQNKESQIVGGRVLEGEITLNTKAEVAREEEVLGQGKIKGLQKEKESIGKAIKGQQVGIMFQSEIKLAENDILQIFWEDREKGTL